MRFTSANKVSTRKGRQYHIAVGPGEVAEKIMLCGDPRRVELAKRLFSHTTLERSNREFKCATGSYRGEKISIMSTGIGPDNMEIVIVELSQIVKDAVLIRAGSCGALSPRIKVGDLVISTAAVRLENTTTFFVPEGYPAVSDYSCVNSLIKSSSDLKIRSHVGITASAPGFYGAQSRKIPPFIPRFEIVRELSRLNVINMEMETSSLFILSSIAGFRAGAVCAVFANRSKNVFIDPSLKKQSELNCTMVAFEALRNI